VIGTQAIVRSLEAQSVNHVFGMCRAGDHEHGAVRVGRRQAAQPSICAPRCEKQAATWSMDAPTMPTPALRAVSVMLNSGAGRGVRARGCGP